MKPGRRHEELLEAFRLVSARIPGARLVVVGRGEGLAAMATVLLQPARRPA